MTAMGIVCSLFSFEDFESGILRMRPVVPTGAEIVYRGWMLTPEMYRCLADAVESHGAHMKTGVAAYRHCHHLPEWYPLCREWTPETIMTDAAADFAGAVAGRNWPGYFVKDYVKSLTTSRGSVARTAEDIAEVVALLKQYRGAIEGGICIRKFEDLDTATEERYFVVEGQPYARDGAVPALVREVATRIASPFFSVDTVMSMSGHLRMIELGDGQVSDRKQWSAAQFAAMLCA